MKSDIIKSGILVLLQVGCLILIFMSGWPVARYLPFSIIESSGILLGFWAFIAMGWRSISISPMVKQGARLVTRGPYSLIRHPMYLAVLLVVWPLIMDQYSLLRFIAGAVLTIDLIVKIFYEENLLRKHFSGYDVYMRSTYRMIPFVF